MTAVWNALGDAATYATIAGLALTFARALLILIRDIKAARAGPKAYRAGGPERLAALDSYWDRQP